MTLPPSYFDDLYAADRDPWGFESRWYERRKRDLTLALLPDERYGSAYEPGCSIGVLTEALAARCEELLATDVSRAAVDAAADRCAHLTNVRVEQARIPSDWPADPVDLVVLSEVGYYFEGSGLDAVAERALSAQTVVAVHWRHDVDDYPVGGEEVHQALHRAATAARSPRLARYEDADVLAEVWSRDPRSVAARQGLVGADG